VKTLWGTPGDPRGGPGSLLAGLGHVRRRVGSEAVSLGG
jgi:hypothetical protein